MKSKRTLLWRSCTYKKKGSTLWIRQPSLMVRVFKEQRLAYLQWEARSQHDMPDNIEMLLCGHFPKKLYEIDWRLPIT